MAGRWPFTAEKIASRLGLIRPYIHRRSRELEPFRLLELPEARVDAPIHADASEWEVIPHESYWGRANLNFVMKTQVSVPEGWDRQKLALRLPLGVMGDIFNHPEALVHIDGHPIGSADRYHHTIGLSPKVADGQAHDLALVGWTGLAGWPPDPDSRAKLFMGRPAVVEIDRDLQAFHDLASAALDTLQHLGPDDPVSEALTQALDAAFIALDTRAPIGEALYDSVPAAMALLEAGIKGAGQPTDQTLHGIGHAHMDIAYLWPISQMRLKNARTYTNVLRLMKMDADFRFSHSQPQLYAMMEQDYPDIFAKIKERVADGRWEVMGGTWVEPDLNIPGPEALVQQFILGRDYFRKTFGAVETPVLWLPDTFGFPAQIPQLMRHAGLKWFVTNKLNWNQKNRVPWSTHYWEALDGSRVLAHVLTTPRDVQYLPFPTNYKSDLSAAEVKGTCDNETIPPSITNLPICFGYGDGGGGPTRDLIAKARAYARMPGMPQMRMSTVRETFAAIEAEAKDLKVWRGEHYMEGHRGVLTSQGWIKRANRMAERALHEAEALSAMAGLTPDLQKAWELLCLNQFHDIVTGTSVPKVFEDARKDFAQIAEIVENVAAKAAAALAGSELSIMNTSPISGPRVVSGPDGGYLYFDDLPAYAVTPVTSATAPPVPVSLSRTADGATLENEFLRAEISRFGHVTRLIHKPSMRDALSDGAIGNQLLAFEDRPICWDAWDIDPFYEDRSEAVSGEITFEIEEDHPLCASLRVQTKWRNSTISQTIRLAAGSQRLDFETTVDWHEQHTLLKAAFPTSVEADQAQFDVQWGHVSRATSRESSFDAARFEVAAHKWAKLSDDTLTVAVLNDCKYGYDVSDKTIRITLIKSSRSPDPGADQGHHHFTYSLFAGEGQDHKALDHAAYSLNTPVRLLPKGSEPEATGSFVQVEADSVIIETLKSCAKSGAIIIRLFEARGQSTQTRLRTSWEILRAAKTDFFGVEAEALIVDVEGVALDMKPWEIATLSLQPNTEKT